MNKGLWATRWAGRVTVIAGVLCALGTVGCSYTCEDTFTCVSLDSGPGCPEDPAEASGGEVPAECGVWVSASLGDDANDGSPDAPLATLAHAAVKATHGRRRVYACAETFDEAVIWPAGMALHGGFDCTDLDWRYLGQPTWTVVTAPAGEIPLTLAGSIHPETSVLSDLKVEAAAAAQPGGSSIAVLAQADARAEVRRSVFKSGDGADGADGDDGDHFGEPAKDGLHGKNGAAACTAGVGTGGELVALDCEEDASFGGKEATAGKWPPRPATTARWRPRPTRRDSASAAARKTS